MDCNSLPEIARAGILERMRLWLRRNSTVPVREQLVTQVKLGILSGDLEPGERLPSVRDLARRHHLNLNTISAGYRDLVENGWLELRRGSGVYVQAKAPEPRTPAEELDHRIAGLFSRARQQGVPLETLRQRLEEWFSVKGARRFLVIEPDPGLREILVAEISRAVRLDVSGCDLSGYQGDDKLEGTVWLALASKAGDLRQELGIGPELLELHVASIPSSLAAWLPAKPEWLIGIASASKEFLDHARTILVAAGFSEDALEFRHTQRKSWQRGLGETDAVVCDSVTAPKLPPGCRAICFNLVSEASLEELRRYEAFVGLAPVAI